MMTAQEFADETGHGLRTVRRWISDGMPGVHRDGHNLSIDPDVALEWLQSRQSATDQIHIAHARRWQLRRWKLAGGGLVPASEAQAISDSIVQAFDMLFGPAWSDNAAHALIHESRPAAIVQDFRGYAEPALIAFGHTVEQAEQRITPNPEIRQADQRIETLELEAMQPRERSETARVRYLTADNALQSGELVRADQAAQQFRDAGTLVANSIRNTARRLANDLAQLTDQAQAARLIANEMQQIRTELNAALARQ